MYNIENLDLGNKLKKLRTSRGLSLETLGNKICKTKTTVSKYEKNEISLDVVTLLEICNALDCKISQFVNDQSVTKLEHSTKNLFGTNIFSIVCKNEFTYLVAATGSEIEKYLLSILFFFFLRVLFGEPPELP